MFAKEESEELAKEGEGEGNGSCRVVMICCLWTCPCHRDSSVAAERQGGRVSSCRMDVTVRLSSVEMVGGVRVEGGRWMVIAEVGF